MRRATVLGVSALTLATGCSDAGLELESLDETSSAIINGQLDSTHQAVVAVFTSNSKCSGTIIHKNGSFGFVLTAAHCVSNAPEFVVQGNNHDQGDYIYTVVDYDAHNGYGGGVNDFAMIRFTGAGPPTPTIPVATSPDGIGTGTAVLHVGYGLIGAQPDVSTSLRHRTTGSVASTTGLTVSFNTPSSGPCFGDSGGPNLTTGTERVIGVNSYVSSDYCNGTSTSGRAAAIAGPGELIQTFISNSPTAPVGCDQCLEAATTGAGACMSAVSGCRAFAACRDLWTCVEGCSNPSCKTACADQAQDAAVVEAYNAVFSGCVCSTACTTDCAGNAVCDTVSPSGEGGSGTGGSGTGGSGTGGSGTGGSGATQDDGSWLAGDTEDQSISGEIVSSCAYSSDRSQGGAAYWLAALALAAGLRRRKS